MKPVQQGDILIKPVGKIPKGAVKVPRENGKLILARGEKTGHCHAIEADGAALWMLTRNGVTELYVEVVAPSVPLVHEEHAAVMLEKGYALVDRKRELDFFEGYERPVID
jgi:hypothetical protein